MFWKIVVTHAYRSIFDCTPLSCNYQGGTKKKKHLGTDVQLEISTTTQ